MLIMTVYYVSAAKRQLMLVYQMTGTMTHVSIPHKLLIKSKLLYTVVSVIMPLVIHTIALSSGAYSVFECVFIFKESGNEDK